MPLTDHRRAILRAAKRVWRQRHPEAHAKAVRRHRQAQRYVGRVLAMGLREADMLPWLEQLGKAAHSRWRSRARDLWDAWQLLCEQQGRVCFVCLRRVALEHVCRDMRGDVIGAVCPRCAQVVCVDVGGCDTQL